MCDWKIPSGATCANPSQPVSTYGISLCTRHAGKLVVYFMDQIRYHAFDDDDGDYLGPRVLAELSHYARRRPDCQVWDWATEMAAQHAVRTRQIRQAEQLVYFAERSGFVKIGTSGNVTERLKALEAGGQMLAGMTAGPLRLLGTMPGGYPEERELHRRFSHLRVDPKREWFLLDGELTEFVADLKSVGSLA